MQGKKQKINMFLNENKKTGKVIADVTSVGRLFHKRLPATGKARSPTVTSLVAGTTRALDIEERSRRRFSSATRWAGHRTDTVVPCHVGTDRQSRPACRRLSGAPSTWQSRLFLCQSVGMIVTGISVVVVVVVMTVTIIQ